MIETEPEEIHRSNKKTCVWENLQLVSLETFKNSILIKIFPGKSVLGEKEREHYRSVMETPRQVFSMWHTLR